MSGIRRVASTGSPNAAATSARSLMRLVTGRIVVAIQERGSSLFLGRLSLATGEVNCAEDRRIIGQASPFAGDAYGMAQATKLVHQACSSASRPSIPAPSDSFDLFHAALASGRHLGHEIAVNRVDRGRKRSPSSSLKPRRDEYIERPLTLLHGARTDSDAFQEAIDHELAAKDTDRSGQSRRQGHDDLCRTRDVVAPRCRDIPHRDDDGLAGFAQPGYLTPDHLRSDRGASG